MQDSVLREAADNIHSALMRWQQQQDDRTREELLLTVRHYLLSGVQIQLRTDGVRVTRKGGWDA